MIHYQFVTQCFLYQCFPIPIFQSIFEQAAAHFPIPRVQQPLPEESAFVVSAREELPPTRLTTASASARGRGGGR
jgi:hypothetical protein